MSDTRKTWLDSKPVAWVISLLIVYSVITFSLETLPDLSPEFQQFLLYSEWVVVLLFSAEYLIRLGLAEHKWRFACSFHGIIDLLAILPFYLALGLDLRSLRLLRMLRLLRILKLARYNQAFKRFTQALLLAKEELVIFIIASFVMLYLAAVGIYYFEHEAQPQVFRSIFDCLWWSVATLTTVGYGDIYPITLGGRLFTFGVLLVGLGLVAVPTGIVASALASIRQTEPEKAE